MIHLESLIQSPKKSLFKRYVDPEYAADWKLVLDTLLKPVGRPYLLKCSFRLCHLPIKVSPIYEKCLALWSKYTTTLDQVEDILIERIWNRDKNMLANKENHVITRILGRLGCIEFMMWTSTFSYVVGFAAQESSAQKFPFLAYIWVNRCYSC